MKTLNGTVCCTPYAFTGLQVEQRASGLKQMANYSVLTTLTALADGPEGIKSGDSILVDGRGVKQPWGISRFKLPDGTECIFVPISAIYGVESK